MSFRCLIRNLRKMQEAKDAAPAMVPREVADRLASVLIWFRYNAAVPDVPDVGKILGEAEEAIADYRKAVGLS
jgi:hypothetical protein